MPKLHCVLGIDIGTSGARALVVDRGGGVPGEAFVALPAPRASGTGREQDARLWWDAVVAAIRAALARARDGTGEVPAIDALAVDATSGTLVPVDGALAPVGPGLMYNDGRATHEASVLNTAAAGLGQGAPFNASYAAAKILWLQWNREDVAARARRFLHQADYVNARLLDARVPADVATDESNALKTGYDPVRRAWSPVLAAVGIAADLLPQVVPTGSTLGVVGPEAAAATGLPPGCRIVAGMTDGTAAAVASGANAYGDGNTTIGTTLVWKLRARAPLADPLGRLYCHRHPGGGFLPGGAGNAGGEGIAHVVVPDAPDPGAALDELAAGLQDESPSGRLCYPLPRPGERFPFIDAAFREFVDPPAATPAQCYRAALEGLACIERWGYEIVGELGAGLDGTVSTTGVGARHRGWMQLRADFLGRPVSRPQRPESGFGAALIAAMNVWHDGDWDTASRLVVESFRCEPRAGQRSHCEQQYRAFRAACARRRR